MISCCTAVTVVFINHSKSESVETMQPTKNIPKVHKMVKHTRKICRKQPTNCLSVFDYFVRFSDIFRAYKIEQWYEMC